MVFRLKQEKRHRWKWWSGYSEKEGYSERRRQRQKQSELRLR